MKNSDEKELESIMDKASEEDEHVHKEDLAIADKYAKIAIESGMILFHDQYKVAFAQLPDARKSIVKIDSSQFMQWLAHTIAEMTEKAAQRAPIATAQLMLAGRAIYKSPEYRLDVRITNRDDVIWIDLCNGKAISVDKTGWRVVEDAPIMFRPYSHQIVQDEPITGGNIKELLTFVNIPGNPEKPTDGQILFLAWTVFAFIPNYPHPILTLYGPKGSAKTTAFAILKHLIDPSQMETLTFSDGHREFVQQAAHHYFAAFDNLSTISSENSDLLCRIVTGEAFSKRALYSDDDDVVYSFRHVLGLNGINVIATKADLLDRSLLIGFEAMPHWTSQKVFWPKFQTAKPRILGAILDVLVAALRIVDNTPESEEMRMADFGRYGCAITEAMGFDSDEFLNAYRRNINRQNDEAIAASILGPAVVKFMEFQNEWSGIATDLLKGLHAVAEDLKIDTKTKYWPKSPHWLWKRLKEIIPNLEKIGIVFKWHEINDRNITIIKTSQNVADAVGVGYSNDINDKNDISGESLPPLF